MVVVAVFKQLYINWTFDFTSLSIVSIFSVYSLDCIYMYCVRKQTAVLTSINTASLYLHVSLTKFPLNIYTWYSNGVTVQQEPNCKTKHIVDWLREKHNRLPQKNAHLILNTLCRYGVLKMCRFLSHPAHSYYFIQQVFYTWYNSWVLQDIEPKTNLQRLHLIQYSQQRC